jgi:hypothetical protein|tara:strand:+ start:1187 stop:1777 length:591 start_codon:yes stop_codon:yes gene_type:complete
MSKKLLDFIDKFKEGDIKTHRALTEYNPNEPQYDSAIGKFRLGDKTGALSDFIKPGDKPPRVDFKLNETPFQDIIPKLKNKGPQKGRKYNQDNKTRNYVWNKVLDNRKKGKRDYENLSTSDIIVAEDKRAKLKELNKIIMKPIYSTPPKKIKEPVQPKVQKTVQEEIQERIDKRPNPLKDTIFDTDSFYLRKKGIL